MPIDYSTYCAKVCGGKCCFVYDEEGDKICACPKLTKENQCAIYKERYEQGQPFKTSIVTPHKGQNKLVVLNCGEIKNIIKAGMLRKEIEDQCCFAHPELLEGDYDS